MDWMGFYGSKWAHKAPEDKDDDVPTLAQVVADLVLLGINLPVTESSNPLDGTFALPLGKGY